MSLNALMLLLLAGVILVLVGVGVYLGALSLFIVGHLISGAKFSFFGLFSLWRPVLQDFFIVFLLWKVISAFSDSVKQKVRLVLLAVIPVWIIWKLFGEWLMASAFGLGLDRVVAQETVMHLSGITGNPVVQVLLVVSFIVWGAKNL